MAISAELIKSNPYFAELSAAELDAIGKFIFERSVEKGEILLFEGDLAEALYFVISGVMKVFKTSADGKEQILQIIHSGESFNDVPVLSGGNNIASAEAMADTSLYGIKKSNLEIISSKYPKISLNIIQILSRRIEHLISLVEDLSFKNVTSRVAKILLENAGDGAGHGQRLTQQEMAAMAGTAREMVGRSLKTLEDEGKIRLDHHRIVITNREALRELAGIAY